MSFLFNFDLVIFLTLLYVDVIFLRTIMKVSLCYDNLPSTNVKINVTELVRLWTLLLLWLEFLFIWVGFHENPFTLSITVVKTSYVLKLLYIREKDSKIFIHRLGSIGVMAVHCVDLKDSSFLLYGTLNLVSLHTFHNFFRLRKKKDKDE